MKEHRIFLNLFKTQEMKVNNKHEEPIGVFDDPGYIFSLRVCREGQDDAKDHDPEGLQCPLLWR